MADSTKIQWADMTFNPWVGCTKVSPGCANCYAEVTTFTRAQRKLGRELWGKGKQRHRTSEALWKQVRRWDKNAATMLAGWNAGIEYVTGSEEKAKAIGFIKPTPPRVFPSLCDWLDDEVPVEWLCDFLFLVYSTPHLNWLLLTKRPEKWSIRIESALKWIESRDGFDCQKLHELLPLRNWLADWFVLRKAPQNIWIGTSCEDQQRADERIPELLKIPAVIHFLSAEPLLGAIDLTRLSADDSMPVTFNALTGFGSWTSDQVSKPVDWVIVGGESGDKARPCNLEWIRGIYRQCVSFNVACFIKQLGKVPVIDNANMWDFPAGTVLEAFGGKRKGFASAVAKLHDDKGGDPSEWPAQIPNVRQFPGRYQEAFAE